MSWFYESSQKATTIALLITFNLIWAWALVFSQTKLNIYSTRPKWNDSSYSIDYYTDVKWWFREEEDSLRVWYLILTILLSEFKANYCVGNIFVVHVCLDAFYEFMTYDDSRNNTSLYHNLSFSPPLVVLYSNDDADARNIKHWLLFYPLWKAIGDTVLPKYIHHTLGIQGACLHSENICELLGSDLLTSHIVGCVHGAINCILQVIY